jgi:ribonuclease D
VTPWIRTRDELARLADGLARCRTVALDSESDSLHHYFEKVCLVQIATDRGDAFLVDPLEIDGLSPLASILADPSIVKVLHGADYDVTTMKRDFGFLFEGLFDTMIASRFAGETRFGLQAMVRSEFGIELSKSSQKDDWSRRPLTPAQEAYALADVAYLVPLHDRLVDRLGALGRLGWVREECEAVAALDPARRRSDPNAFLGIRGAKALRPRGLAVLRELHAWREERAASLDTPAFRVMSSETLLSVAAKGPRSRKDLEDVKGLPARVRERPGELLEAVRRGLALPDGRLPVPPRRARPPLPEAVRRRVDRLKAWRAEAAARLGLDVSLVLPQRLLEQVAALEPRGASDLLSVEGIRRWRVEAVGPEIVATLLS